MRHQPEGVVRGIKLYGFGTSCWTHKVLQTTIRNLDPISRAQDFRLTCPICRPPELPWPPSFPRASLTRPPCPTVGPRKARYLPLVAHWPWPLGLAAGLLVPATGRPVRGCP